MRILIVDDDEEMVLLLTRAMSRKGHEVDALYSGFGVVNRVLGRDGQPPDLLILDYSMPGLSGGGILEILARNPDAAKVPVLLYTAMDRSSVVELEVHPNVSYVAKGRLAGLFTEVAFAEANLLKKTRSA